MTSELTQAGFEGLHWARAQPVSNHSVYEGTAGLLRAVAEAALHDLDSWRLWGEALRDELLSATITASSGRPTIELSSSDLSLYLGSAGHAAALETWAVAAGDSTALDGTRRITARIAELDVPAGYDVISGAAGVIPVLVASGQLGAVGRYADRLASVREYTERGVFWRIGPGNSKVLPNFAHGTAGVCYALTLAGEALHRPDLIDLAREGARTLLNVGRREDGSVAVPYVFSVDGVELTHEMSYERTQWGWCNGAAGTVQLFLRLAALEPGWDDAVSGILRAVRTSGIPRRLRPGFWDNVGQCCGTAGVGELALDRYQATGDVEWQDWAGQLAADVMRHATSTSDGICWSNLEYRSEQPVLPPEPGYLQGAAGVAAFLLRLERVRRDGVDAVRLPWPDRS